MFGDAIVDSGYVDLAARSGMGVPNGVSGLHPRRVLLDVPPVAGLREDAPEFVRRKSDRGGRRGPLAGNGTTLEAFRKGELSKPQMLQLALSWKGTTNFLGWGGLAPKLEPSLRGPIALVLGHQYRRLNKPADSLAAFKIAAADARRVRPSASSRRRRSPHRSDGRISPQDLFDDVAMHIGQAVIAASVAMCEFLVVEAHPM